MIAAILVIGVAVMALGVTMVVDAWTSPADSVPPIRRTRRVSVGGLGMAVVLGSAVAVVAGGLSGWLAPSVVVGCVVAGATWSARQVAGGEAGRMATVEALAGWVENLRDVLSAGEQPLGAVAGTVSTCPPPIRAQVRRLSAGLARQDPSLVLRRFADDVDDPLGDLIAAGLLIAIAQGGRSVGVLSALAEQARAQSDRRRLIEAERAPMRREVRILTLIMGALISGLFVFARSDYLRAYSSMQGQLFLSTALVAFAVLLVRVRGLARFSRPARFLTARTERSTGQDRTGRTKEGVR